jgi:hypothetical protein
MINSRLDIAIGVGHKVGKGIAAFKNKEDYAGQNESYTKPLFIGRIIKNKGIEGPAAGKHSLRKGGVQI